MCTSSAMLKSLSHFQPGVCSKSLTADDIGNTRAEDSGQWLQVSGYCLAVTCSCSAISGRSRWRNGGRFGSWEGLGTHGNVGKILKDEGNGPGERGAMLGGPDTRGRQGSVLELPELLEPSPVRALRLHPC